VEISSSEDRKLHLPITKTRCFGADHQGSRAHRQSAATSTRQVVGATVAPSFEEIAKTKLPDLNCTT